ncbi:PRP38 family-domain-containing protein [Halteromyces radiatus]|uniref:PRP38 family-domain-containing protein n=1 Tax=Halteromyces radiatus TaxID=101107 RepID=UPI00221F2448|nr:PRP38 family-domain-containing protein [Halteromyces radiatus]KAI8093244.1 PRP38 family-domain-containing protein [Halteromyces radiatus]
MANRTIAGANWIHGRDPQHLIEKIIRERIYDSMYWKEECFGLTAVTLMDKAVELNSIGGEYGNHEPTHFLCLTLKMLQLQPEREILTDLIKQEDFKYLRALAAFYLRIVGQSKEIYQYLEPLLNDYRKLRVRVGGGYTLSYMDEFIDQLLHQERVCDVILPRLVQRHVLEDNDELEPRVSALEDDLESEDGENKKDDRSQRHRSPSSSPEKNERRHRSPSSSPERRDDHRRRHRSPSSSPERRDDHRRHHRSPSTESNDSESDGRSRRNGRHRSSGSSSRHRSRYSSRSRSRERRHRY